MISSPSHSTGIVAAILFDLSSRRMPQPLPTECCESVLQARRMRKGLVDKPVFETVFMRKTARALLTRVTQETLQCPSNEHIRRQELCEKDLYKPKGTGENSSLFCKVACREMYDFLKDPVECAAMMTHHFSLPAELLCNMNLNFIKHLTSTYDDFDDEEEANEQVLADDELDDSCDHLSEGSDSEDEDPDLIDIDMKSYPANFKHDYRNFVIQFAENFSKDYSNPASMYQSFCDVLDGKPNHKLDTDHMRRVHNLNRKRRLFVELKRQGLNDEVIEQNIKDFNASSRRTFLRTLLRWPKTVPDHSSRGHIDIDIIRRFNDHLLRQSRMEQAGMTPCIDKDYKTFLLRLKKLFPDYMQS